jgi:pimeloyl-ACP methyl ester carboxylesterase
MLDPVVMSLAQALALSRDPTERAYPTLEEALSVIRSANPSWTEGDVLAKARSLTQVDEAAARAILLDNGDWDGGLAALRRDKVLGVETWIVRGEPATGSLTPDAALPSYAGVVGEDHVLTIAGGPHSPQRTHPEAFLVAVLRALA